MSAFPEYVYVRLLWDEAKALAGGIDSSPKYADWEAISTAAKHVHEAMMEQAAGDDPPWLNRDVRTLSSLPARSEAT